MDVLTTAWTAVGAPTSPSSTHGPCARCGQHASLTATRTVVSKVFTSFDTWVDPAGAGVCPACAWGYSTPSLRSSAHLVIRSPKSSLSSLTRPAVLEVLGDEAELLQRIEDKKVGTYGTVEKDLMELSEEEEESEEVEFEGGGEE